MAAKASLLKFLKGTVTQGSADAFVQGSITTGLSNESRAAYRVLEVQLSVGPWAEVDATYQVAFTRKSVASMPLLSDKHTIAYYMRQVAITTSGSWNADSIIRQPYFGDQFIIVEDPLYVSFDSSGTSASNVLYYSICYEDCTISEDDRLNLLVNALQG